MKYLPIELQKVTTYPLAERNNKMIMERDCAGTVFPGMSVLQIDAHADMRDAYMGTRHNHACAMRRCHPPGEL